MEYFCHECQNIFVMSFSSVQRPNTINPDSSNDIDTTQQSSTVKCPLCNSEFVEIVERGSVGVADLFEFALDNDNSNGGDQEMINQNNRPNNQRIQNEVLNLFNLLSGRSSSTTRSTAHHSSNTDRNNNSSEFETDEEIDVDGGGDGDGDNGGARRSTSSTNAPQQHPFFRIFASMPSSDATATASQGDDSPFHRNIANLFSVVMNRQGVAIIGRGDGADGNGITEILPFDLTGLFGMHSDPRDYAFGNEEFNRILQQLFEQASGDKQQKPANDDIIAKFPIVVVNNEKELQKLIEGFPSTATECTICKDVFKVTDRVMLLTCKHHFHQDCITAWLKVNGSCPVCRTSFTTEQQQSDDGADIDASNVSSLH